MGRHFRNNGFNWQVLYLNTVVLHIVLVCGTYILIIASFTSPFKIYLYVYQFMQSSLPNLPR